ncbi:DEAD/DEAH box helicase, partial [Aphanothece microscopica]|uniref:DEAD/DEAH box helicase n=1 Tax=Aphanothece microscopica TaxID=1049561 RepID=UPI00398557E3
IEKLVKESYVEILSKNFNNKQFDPNRLNGLQLALSPVAIARIQKVLLELMITGVLKIEAPTWKIAIYERDVPCAQWAIEDLRNQLWNIFKLAGKKLQLPEIELLIITTPEFQSSAMNKGIDTLLVSEVPSSYSCDVLIDISVLMRSKVHKYKLPDIRYQHSIVIRSSHHANTKRQFYTSDLIDYGGIAESDQKQKALTYFLQSIFRKVDFRPGQLEILNRALQIQSVIGLLPTGGGKSLTYQLAVLLQPGVTLVIDPIKSLMKDQVDNLVKNRIDACIFINSSLKTPQERNRIIAQMKGGQALFTFVSPERLLSQ